MDMNNLDTLEKLVNFFRPIYYFHTAERFYPCDFGDVMRQCSLLYKHPDGKDGKMEEIIQYPHLNNRTFRADKAALVTEGISLENKHVEALSWKPVDSAASPDADRYMYTINQSGTYFFKLYNRDILPGNLTGGATGTPSYFDNEKRGGNEKTSYENGYPFCPEYWAHMADNPEKICQTRGNEILSVNKKLIFSPNPQYCSISQRVIGGESYTDFIYVTFLAMNGSISILPGVGTHVIDVEVVGVRFKGRDISESSAPFRYYFAQHAGFSWYEPKDCEFKILVNQNGAETKHLVVYFARESHEVYPKPGVWQRIYGFANDLCNQGVLWTPPARYINIPTDETAHKIRQYYAQKLNTDPYKIMLIPEERNGRGPEWYYSVTPAHLPGLEGMPAGVKKKIELPESGVNGTELTECENATTKAGDHSEPGTYIDEAVPESLDPIWPDNPCPEKDRPVGVSTGVRTDVNSFRKTETGESSLYLTEASPVCERTFMDATQPPGTDVLEAINNMILPQMSGFLYKTMQKPLIDGYQKDWAAQSGNPYRMEEKDYPIWYHKENCVFFDLQVWLHSTESSKKMHPGDEAKGYKGGIKFSGLEHLVFGFGRSSTKDSFVLNASLRGGTIKATANAEIGTKKNRGGFSIGNPHAVCTITIDRFDLEVECRLKLPVAITDKGVIRYCIDKNGRHTPGPTAIGWFVPNVQWAHGDKEEFEKIANASDYCKEGLPPDAVLRRDEFNKLMNCSSKIKILQRHATVDVEFLGFLGGHVEAARQFAEFLQTGNIGDFLRTLTELASIPWTLRWMKGIGWVLQKILNAVAPVRLPLLEFILSALKPKLEKLLDDEVTKLFNHPPSL